jgi:hypothetical protein
MFVGTSAGEKDNHIGLFADMLRVKKGDFIFFYIEGWQNKKGRFFGVFKALDNDVHHITGKSALIPNLPVKLIYRKKIIPYKIYPQGILEWIALDRLPTYAKEILWSLIYRKTKGKRGNTMLLPWEVERLLSMIEDVNDGKVLKFNNLSFIHNTYEITKGKATYKHSMGNPVTVSLTNLKKSETHFQAYILQNLKITNNTSMSNIFGRKIAWIGNEVFAGSGMQKIDILTIEKLDETSYLYRIIELKHPKSFSSLNFASFQLEYYINWAREDIGGHILGGKKLNIKPMLVVLTRNFNSIHTNVIKEIKSLSSISTHPEIWEIDFKGAINKVL